MEPTSQPIVPGIMTQKRHSAVGILAFVFSLVGLAFLLLLAALSFVIFSDLPEGAEPTENEYIGIGCLVILFLFFDLAALGLGIGGLVQNQYKRILPAVGFSISALLGLGTLILILA